MTVYRSKPGPGRGTKGRTQRLWMRTVAAGDVLRGPRGLLRVVRRALFYQNGDLRGLTFAIRHRSWTGRPYTCVNYTDLMAWTPTGARVALDTEADAVLLQDIITNRQPPLTSIQMAMDMP